MFYFRSSNDKLDKTGIPIAVHRTKSSHGNLRKLHAAVLNLPPQWPESRIFSTCHGNPPITSPALVRWYQLDRDETTKRAHPDKATVCRSYIACCPPFAIWSPLNSCSSQRPRPTFSSPIQLPKAEYSPVTTTDDHSYVHSYRIATKPITITVRSSPSKISLLYSTTSTRPYLRHRRFR